MRPKIISDSDLIRLATEVIISQGPELFTIRGVAKHANVSPATIIKRFSNRSNLLSVCISDHISKISDTKLNTEFSFEEFILNQSIDHKKDNFVQNLSMLAADMREPSLRTIAKKYFEGFRESLNLIIEGDSRFDAIADKKAFIFQVEALFHGAIIQGAFLEKASIRQNLIDRITSYLSGQCNIILEWPRY